MDAKLICYVAAIVLFIVAALPVDAIRTWRLECAGLAFFAAGHLVG